MGIYVFEQGDFDNNYGIGAAIPLLMLVIVATMSVFLRAQGWCRSGDVD